jgi:DNA-binding transcriptional ArsR family regulator
MIKTSDERSSVLSLDEIFDVLVSPRRRKALYVLYERSKPVGVDDLAAAVAAEMEVDADRLGRIAISLDHTHLPKLEQARLVSYDRKRGTVELNTVPCQFKRYLRYAAEDDELSQGEYVVDLNDAKAQ